jgi:peptidoglycan/xylan/chitin deacetylase (PgdA/CDA1 family)
VTVPLATPGHRRRAAPAPRPVQVLPILLYHSVDDGPPPWIAPFTVPPAVFARHLDHIVETGCHVLTVSEAVDCMENAKALPARPVVVTFDDGFADLAERAAPALAARGLRATAYITTGALRGRPRARHRLPPARMLHWNQLADLEGAGVEIGAHTVLHGQLDVLPPALARREIQASKAELEDVLGYRVRSFAYPHGYHSQRVKDLVRGSGFESACAVKNALSWTQDDRFALGRLTVTASTSPQRLAQWLAGQGAPVSPSRRSIRTRAWRQLRRVGAVTTYRERP